jgi:hypothetical protein
MFPTVRLLIAAVFASVVALSCGFGVFAAFRVNHEPFSRQPAATAPLQLLDGEAAAAPASWGAPFGPGFRLNDAQSDAAATHAAALAPTRSERAAPNPWTVGTVQPAALTEAGPMPEPRRVELDAATAPTAAAASPIPMPDALAQAVAAIAPPPARAPAIAQPADVTGSIGEIPRAKARVSPAVTRKLQARTRRKIAGRTVKRHRRGAGRRISHRVPVSAVARSGSGNATDQEPVFQSAPTFENSPQLHPRTARNAKYAVPGSAFGSPVAQ